MCTVGGRGNRFTAGSVCPGAEGLLLATVRTLCLTAETSKAARLLMSVHIVFPSILQVPSVILARLLDPLSTGSP
jgi:hypothetical protein